MMASQKNDYIEFFYNHLQNVKDEIKQLRLRVEYNKSNLDQYNELKRNLESFKNILIAREEL